MIYQKQQPIGVCAKDVVLNNHLCAQHRWSRYAHDWQLVYTLHNTGETWYNAEKADNLTEFEVNSPKCEVSGKVAKDRTWYTLLSNTVLSILHCKW